MKRQYWIVIIVFLIYSGILSFSMFKWGESHKEAEILSRKKTDSTITYHHDVPIKEIKKDIPINKGKTKSSGYGIFVGDSLYYPGITDIVTGNIDTGDSVISGWVIDTLHSHTVKDGDILIDKEVFGKDTLTVTQARGVYEVTLKHSLEQIIKEVTVYKSLPFYQKFTFGYLSGVLTVIIILLIGIF